MGGHDRPMTPWAMYGPGALYVSCSATTGSRQPRRTCVTTPVASNAACERSPCQESDLNEPPPKRRVAYRHLGAMPLLVMRAHSGTAPAFRARPKPSFGTARGSPNRRRSWFLGYGGLRPAARRAAPRQDCGHDFHRIAFQTVGLRPTLAPLERVDAVGINTARPAPRLEPQRKAGRCRRGMVRAQCRPLPTTSR